MIYVAFVELLNHANHTLVTNLGNETGQWVTITCFFAGILTIAAIDKLVPNNQNPHEAKPIEHKHNSVTAQEDKLQKMSIMTAVAISIHNFPEGIATFMAAMENTDLGMAIAAAIAIHNVPEGIAVAVPVLHATKSRKKAFMVALLSGVAEPVGAVIAYLFLMNIITPNVMATVFAAVAGIMVFISLDELLPTAHQYGEYHVAIYGLVIGMAIMAVSLVLL
jgi:ZIP family zinc transporter